MRRPKQAGTIPKNESMRQQSRPPQSYRVFLCAQIEDESTRWPMGNCRRRGHGWGGEYFFKKPLHLPAECSASKCRTRPAATHRTTPNLYRSERFVLPRPGIGRCRGIFAHGQLPDQPEPATPSRTQRAGAAVSQDHAAVGAACLVRAGEPRRPTPAAEQPPPPTPKN